MHRTKNGCCLLPSRRGPRVQDQQTEHPPLPWITSWGMPAACAVTWLLQASSREGLVVGNNKKAFLCGS